MLIYASQAETLKYLYLHVLAERPLTLDGSRVQHGGTRDACHQTRPVQVRVAA
jgi:hypothetical protein